MTHTKDEALRMALEALETELSIDWTNNDEFNASAEKMQEAITAIKQSRALDKMAENARELGLDYEPAHVQPVATLFGSLPVYDTTPPAQPAPVREPDDSDINQIHEANAQVRYETWTPPKQPAPVQEPVVIPRGLSRDEFLQAYYVSASRTIKYLRIENDRILSTNKIWHDAFLRATKERDAAEAECQHLKVVTATPPAQPAPVQEPLEYWNAVEGWVKIDEVREHFDSVGCGTIYKTAGEGRVPLTAAQRKPLTHKQMVDAIEPLYLNRSTAEMAAKVSIDEFRAIEAAHGIKE